MKQSEAGIASDVFQGERRQFVRLDLLQWIENRPLSVPERSLSSPHPQTVSGRGTTGDGVSVQNDTALTTTADRHPSRERHVGAPKSDQVDSQASGLRAHTRASEWSPAPFLTRSR